MTQEELKTKTDKELILMSRTYNKQFHWLKSNLIDDDVDIDKFCEEFITPLNHEIKSRHLSYNTIKEIEKSVDNDSLAALENIKQAETKYQGTRFGEMWNEELSIIERDLQALNLIKKLGVSFVMPDSDFSTEHIRININTLLLKKEQFDLLVKVLDLYVRRYDRLGNVVKEKL